jgi:hypothetical protein
MKVLIVGCGAVGQVYGLRLQKAGVTLGYLDRPATVDQLKQALAQGGIPLFQISHSHRRDPKPHWLKNFQLFTDPVEARLFQPDQIWFTTPSQVYYSEWFREFLQTVPSERVVCFIPEGPRPEFLPENGRDRLVCGGTTFMAWQGSLEVGGGGTEGVHFWLPPLGIPLVGTKIACREVEQVLRKAGFQVTIGAPDSHAQAAATAGMTAFMAGLELSGWSLRAYRKSPWLKRAARAGGEGVLGQLPAASALTRALLGVPVLSAAFFLVALCLPLLVPFEIEKYLKFHYTKTREQTLILLDLFVKDGIKSGLPVGTIQLLVQGLQDR